MRMFGNCFHHPTALKASLNGIRLSCLDPSFAAVIDTIWWMKVGDNKQEGHDLFTSSKLLIHNWGISESHRISLNADARTVPISEQLLDAQNYPTFSSVTKLSRFSLKEQENDWSNTETIHVPKVCRAFRVIADETCAGWDHYGMFASNEHYFHCGKCCNHWSCTHSWAG